MLYPMSLEVTYCLFQEQEMQRLFKKFRESSTGWKPFIKQLASWTTSVCTGSLILGAAGLLKNLRATTHWAALDRLSTWGANPVSERIVEDGKVMTAAGVSAGIDMALTLAAKLSGLQIAQSLQLGIEYDPSPPFDVGSPQKASPAILEALRSRLATSFESPQITNPIKKSSLWLKGVGFLWFRTGDSVDKRKMPREKLWATWVDSVYICLQPLSDLKEKTLSEKEKSLVWRRTVDFVYGCLQNVSF